MARVAVVGAGLAGLAAADALVRDGIEVVVLEARDRVGGRVWSRKLRNGAVVELGAEFILPGNDTIRSFVDRFGLGLWDKGMRYGQREPRGVDIDATRLRDALATVQARLADLGPAATTRSALRFLDDLPLDPGAREAIQSRLEVSSAATADRVPASTLGGLAGHSDDVSPSIAGGNQRLAVALARGLAPAVHLSTPVERIAWGDAGVRVSTTGSELTVDRVVLAVPASVVGRIEFRPALPESLHAAYAAVEYGHAAKLIVELAAPAAPSAVLSVPERYWTWTATGASDVQPVVSCFAGSALALEALEVAHGPERWLSSVQRLRPDLALARESAVLSTWDDDPWVAAAYSCAAPPVGAWGPAGPFHVCGEHTAGDAAALMDGALASGLRAAREVVEGLRGAG